VLVNCHRNQEYPPGYPILIDITSLSGKCKSINKLSCLLFILCKIGPKGDPYKTSLIFSKNIHKVTDKLKQKPARTLLIML
jgi:hypothetical protein